MLTVLEDGGMVEIATIGREGMVGVAAAWDGASMMLGASRPTVTVVAGTLQKAGLITYHRGHVTITDGENLEAASCECYRTATNLLRAVTASKS
jgi:Mn-dependent DtxR family transcriptional regulator